MKFKNTFIILFALFSLSILGTAFINGPANRGHDKTGSPLSDGTCLNCHSSGSFSPSLHVAMFEGDSEVDSYEPGKTYTLKYQLINTGSPAAFGFQTVALDESDETIGTFSDLPDGFRKINLKEVDYVEHSSPRPLSSFEVSWTAPADATGEISFYSAGVAANGNNNTGGDGADTDVISFLPNTSSSDEVFSDLNRDVFMLKSNLVNNHISILLNDAKQDHTFYLFDSRGTLIKTQTVSKNNGKQIDLPVADLPSNFYYLQGINRQQGKTVKFFKN